MAAAKSKNDLQFSLRALMVFVTVTCIVFAFPGGYILLAAGTVWMLIGGAITKTLLTFRTPINRFLSGAKLKKKSK